MYLFCPIHKLKFFLTISVVIFLTACTGKEQPTAVKTQKDTTLYPYSPIYTDTFEKGKSSNTLKVLQLWKEFESGDVRHLAGFFADSITLIFPDEYITGSRDVVLSSFQKRRNRFEDVQCYVDAWIPMHVEERKEDLVFIWGRQDGSSTGKKRVYRVLHEIWRFDTSGKIKRMEQYITHPF
jgi:hypothetical protein